MDFSIEVDFVRGSKTIVLNRLIYAIGRRLDSANTGAFLECLVVFHEIGNENGDG